MAVRASYFFSNERKHKKRHLIPFISFNLWSIIYYSDIQPDFLSGNRAQDALPIAYSPASFFGTPMQSCHSSES
jgi:hypothetical protein